MITARSEKFNHENRHSGTGYTEKVVLFHEDFNHDFLRSGTPL